MNTAPAKHSTAMTFDGQKFATFWSDDYDDVMQMVKLNRMDSEACRLMQLDPLSPNPYHVGPPAKFHGQLVWESQQANAMRPVGSVFQLQDYPRNPSLWQRIFGW